MKFWRNRGNENGKPRRRLLVAEQKPLKLPRNHHHHPCPVSDPQQMRGVQQLVEPKAMLHQSHTDHPEGVAAGATILHQIDHLLLIAVLLEPIPLLRMLLPAEHNLPRLLHLDDTFHLQDEDRKSSAALIVRG